MTLADLRRRIHRWRKWTVERVRPTPRGEGLTVSFVVPARLLDTFEEIAEGAAAVLRSHDVSSRVQYVKRWTEVRSRPGDTLVVFGGYRFDRVAAPEGVRLVGVSSEQFGPTWTPLSTASDRFLAGCERVLAINECLLLEHRRRKVPAEAVLPFGYTPGWEGPPIRREPEYDVAFLGRTRSGDRRRRILEDLARRFYLQPETRAFGAARFRFLASARIQLSLHQTEEPMLPSHRFALCLANGVFLLSEPLPPGAPFRPGVHYAEAPEKDIAGAIEHYLENEHERRRIAGAGRDFFRNRYRLDRAVLDLLPHLVGPFEPPRTCG